jgi:hypothetical protein
MAGLPFTGKSNAMNRCILVVIFLGIVWTLSAQTKIYPAFMCEPKEPVPLNLDSIKCLLGKHPDEIEGKVVFRILLNENGKYIRHLVLKTPHPLMTAYYEPIVPLIRWTPAQNEGNNIACWVCIPFQACLLR